MSSERGVAVPLPVPDILEADEHHYRILVRDLVLDCRIGAYPEERLKTQRVRFNLDLRVRRPIPPLNDDLEKVISYDKIIAEIRNLVAAGHINLVETLAEQIADICLADRRVVRARCRWRSSRSSPLPPASASRSNAAGPAIPRSPRYSRWSSTAAASPAAIADAWAPASHGNASRPWVVKLGGSLQGSPNLRRWLKVIAASAAPVVIVPGGGPFADEVRLAQKRLKFSDAVAHHMALLAMEQYGRVHRRLGSLRLRPKRPSPSIKAACGVGQVAGLAADKNGAWAAGYRRKLGRHLRQPGALAGAAIESRGLVLVKSARLPKGPRTAAELSRRGIVDAAFPRMLAIIPARSWCIEAAGTGWRQRPFVPAPIRWQPTYCRRRDFAGLCLAVGPLCGEHDPAHQLNFSGNDPTRMSQSPR